MDNITREPVRELLNCFFAECESELRFLERKHGYQSISGLAEYRNGRQLIRPYHSQDLQDIFHAVARYEKGNMALEILYGDENLAVQAYITYDNIYRLSLEDLLQAARLPAPKTEPAPMMQRRALRDTVGTLARALSTHKKILLEPSKRLIQRAVILRARRMEQALRAQLSRQIEQACITAARAFVARDYRRVIELLTPYETFLARADMKKLNAARRHIGPAK